MPKNTKIITIVALMLVLALATLDSTIVATAMPNVVSQLGGITLYSWAFSAYLLTSTTVVPLYGKLADLYGRKLILLIGSLIFLVGSAACGSAQSMEQLIFFRGLQGLGAGAIQPLVLTIIADISASVQENARMQGVVGALWGVSSVVGPLLGGLIVDHFSWPWIFYLNLPLGLLALVLLAIFYRESFVRQKHKLDYLGTVLLTGAVIALLLFLLQGGTAWAWISWPSLALLLATLILFLVFSLVERRAAEPILPLELFAERTIAISNSGSFLLGCIIFSLMTYVPLFVQGVQGGSATEAGFALVPNLVSWAITSMVASVILARFGNRLMVLVGAVVTVVGVGMAVFFKEQTSFAFIALAMVVMGLGFGLVAIIYTLAVQQAARKEMVGVATASTLFVKMIGGTVGVAIMGAILNGQMQARFAPIMGHFAKTMKRLPPNTPPANLLLVPDIRALLPTALLEQLKIAFSQSLFWVFLSMLALALVSLLIMLWFPADPAPKAVKGGSTEEKELAQSGF
ncbi:DHA2 family efflux MFS transporter permease subunit [Ktedonosporobacter rubrisoli]|uniref:DHA2 family efflux MFS transporter permease subunit n=1 Tax=Ktedonosporobacter rubrisoli TaxID=2509675 RepID=A0A4P6JWI4_KTERU|nr:MDR family MFS transporter [Ktedonosporobacter rubrisoli]QBD79773.1 DHA2 family efflux MFS transporter permease subunit [Ktedonosporobacter rubrisoli]